MYSYDGLGKSRDCLGLNLTRIKTFIIIIIELGLSCPTEWAKEAIWEDGESRVGRAENGIG
jgi:hypothetical protein